VLECCTVEHAQAALGKDPDVDSADGATSCIMSKAEEAVAPSNVSYANVVAAKDAKDDAPVEAPTEKTDARDNEVRPTKKSPKAAKEPSHKPVKKESSPAKAPAVTNDPPAQTDKMSEASKESSSDAKPKEPATEETAAGEKTPPKFVEAPPPKVNAWAKASKNAPAAAKIQPHPKEKEKEKEKDKEVRKLDCLVTGP
jgi:hypothetical protein